ncbi:MAG TPA: ribosome maturation factor RimP [Terriglobales bacterium]|nr:ribosome maturation factor RimP [Terriglobales bacterium]
MALDIEHIRAIAERVTGSAGLELVEVEMRGGGKFRTLRIVIDRPGPTPSSPPAGVTHEDCATVSREVSAILDVEDAVPGGSYTLEVSSPGLDRKLVRPLDYERFTGSRVHVMTREPLEGNRHFEGRLEGFREGRLTLKVEPGRRERRRQGAVERRLEIELGNVEKARVVPEI